MSGTIVFSGFDSAWTPGNRGAIAHVRMTNGVLAFCPPISVNFAEALTEIEAEGKVADARIIGIDQPLIVPNQVGYRPVERVFQPMLCSLKTAIQPAYRDKDEMFGDLAPIRDFMDALGAKCNPSATIHAMSGRHTFEIYPAAALIGLFPLFLERRRAAKYNPGRRKTFSIDDWRIVCSLIGQMGDELEIEGLKTWCGAHASLSRPMKADQDRLDAAICVVITYLWWRFGYARSMVVGDLETGYIVTPTNPDMSARIAAAALIHGVPINSRTEA